MVKITGGVPGGWHGGQLPGASAPFRFQFDAQGCAEVESEVAQYLTSVPGPFALIVDQDFTDAIEPQEDTPQELSEETPKRRTTRRKTSLDE